MGLRFRKSIKIAPGVKINLNKKSTSVTFGGKGVHYTASSTGKKNASVGIPGTGISYTKTTGQSNKQKKTSEGGSQPMPTAPQSNFQDPDHKKWYQKTGWIIALLILFFPVGLFLMWKYTNWKKSIKGIITAIILIFALSGIASPDNLEQITLSADTGQTYDINKKISIKATTTPTDYELSSDDFKCSGGKINIDKQSISFVATKDGSYKIWAEHDGIKSNNLTLKVEDKAAIAKQKAKEEQKRLAAEKAKKEAEEKAAQEKAAEEKAAQEAAAAKAKAEAEAAAQAQAQAEAQQQAQAAAQAQAQQQQTQAQQQTGEIVYWVPNGQVYHSTQDCPSLGRSSTIYSGTIAQSGKSRPCKNCY